MRKLGLFFIFGVFVFILSACGKADDEETFVVGMECAYAPYNWTVTEETDTSYPIDGTNQYCDGYDVQVARTIADELDVKLVIKAMDWDGLIPALNANQIDAIIAGMSPTSKRKETISFSDPYYRSADATEQVLVVLKDGDYADATTIQDFSGANIAAQIGTLQDEEGLIEQMTGAVHATPLTDYPTLVTALKSGTIDGFIAELAVAKQNTQSNEELTYIQFSEGNGFTLNDAFTTSAIGLRQSDTELRDDINEALATISDSQRTTWMNEFIESSSSDE